MRSSIKGGLKLCAIYVVYAVVMLTLAYFSGDERISGLLNLLVWWPGGIILVGMMWLSPGHFPAADPGLQTGLLVAAASLLVVFLIGFAFTCIKNAVS